jgi:hypothetical protein
MEGHQTVAQERSVNCELQLRDLVLQLEAQTKRLAVLEKQLAVKQQYARDLEVDFDHVVYQLQKLRTFSVAVEAA